MFILLRAQVGILMLYCQIKFWTNSGGSDAAARVELISSRHDKGISWVETLFITQVTAHAAKPALIRQPGIIVAQIKCETATVFLIRDADLLFLSRPT